MRRVGGWIAGEDLPWEAPRLGRPEAHVVERLAAAPPAPAARRALAPRRQILARPHPRAALARPGSGGGRRDQEEQREQGRGSGCGHLRRYRQWVRGESRTRRQDRAAAAPFDLMRREGCKSIIILFCYVSSDIFHNNNRPA